MLHRALLLNSVTPCPRPPPPTATMSETFKQLIWRLLFFLINYFNWRLITILWWFLPYIDMNQPQIYVCPPSRTPLPPPFPFHPSGLSQCTGFECPVSCIGLGLVICFTYSNICVSVLVSQIIPPSPSPTESKSLFFIPVFLFLS